MKAALLLLCLLRASLAFPLRQAERILSASHSGEMLQLLQMYNMMGNTPDQTQPVHPAHGLPPAQLVPDMTAQQQQQHHQFQPADNVFGNLLPVYAMHPGFPQSPGNQPPGFMPYPQALPMNVGEMTFHHSMFPHPHHLFPIIITQMGQQGMMSSEEMQLVPQVFAGVILPQLPGLPGLPALPGLPFLPPLLQGAMIPGGGAGVSLDEQDVIPMGQAGANANSQHISASPAPSVTQGQDTREMLTIPAGVRKAVSDSSRVGLGNAGLFQTYTTPAVLKQFPTGSATEVMFVEPTGFVTDTSPSSGDERHQHSYRAPQQQFNHPIRGDQHQPMIASDIKPLRRHKKRRA